MAENDFLKWLTDHHAISDASVLAGIGEDDCAWVMTAHGDNLCITTDTLLENVHFTTEATSFDIGWKSVAVNLSDLASSGCKPCWGTVGLGMRKGLGEEWARSLAEGMFACASEYGLSLVGGDTTSGAGPASITVTVVGSPYADQPVLRNGAQVGDVLVVTGALGGSILGRHYRPVPRFDEIAHLLATDPTGVHACMDLSDGLSMDLPRMMNLSETGALITEKYIPYTSDAKELAGRDGKSAFWHSINDGEDFELLLAITPSLFDILEKNWPDNIAPITKIGCVTADQKILIHMADGSTGPLLTQGYEHGFN